MLPYFKIIQGENANNVGDIKNFQMQEGLKKEQSRTSIPTKPSRKSRRNPNTVPVHHHRNDNFEKSERHEHDKPNRKTFSANFNGHHSKVLLEDDTDKRFSRKHMFKELERFKCENEELQKSYDHLTKKNSKLKEKLAILFEYNQTMLEETATLKQQYEEIYNQYIACKNILEEPKVCQRCMEMDQNIESIKREYFQLKKSNQECLEDCSMLKNVVYRLNVQLERYQEKLRENNLSIKEKPKVLKDYDEVRTVSAESINKNEQHSSHNYAPVQWGKVNTHTLAPLLNGYEEIIAEKDEIIENYETEMAIFTGKLKEILKENEELHFKLTEDNDCSKVLKEQLDADKKEVKNLREQNDLLIKKCALKQDKVEEILKCYESKVDMLKRDYSVLHDTYCKAKAEIATLKERNKALADAQDEHRNERSQFIPLSVHTSSVNECKKWYEELKTQYEAEKLKLENTIGELRTQMTDMSKKINEANAEKHVLENKLKSCEKHMKKAETKYLELEHSLHEVQLSRSACRKQLNKAMNFAKDLVNEQEVLLKALNQRHIENKAVKRLGTDIASRMDILRNQLKTVQKEAWQELSTVEERIQEQDSMILSMKEEHEQEIERLKGLIQENQNKDKE